MIIRRDCMLLAPPSAQRIAAAAARGAYSSPPTSIYVSPNPSYPSPGSLNGTPNVHSTVISIPTPSPPPLAGQYALSPLQQREAMQREVWEKERSSLLKKASNAQGDSVERLVRDYLAF